MPEGLWDRCVSHVISSIGPNDEIPARASWQSYWDFVIVTPCLSFVCLRWLSVLVVFDYLSNNEWQKKDMGKERENGTTK